MALTLNHTSVLLHEAIEPLIYNPDGIYIDGTFGRGGHSKEILRHLSAKGRLIAFDRDPLAVSVAQSWQDPRFQIIHSAFSNMQAELQKLGIQHVHGITLDVGVSSPQLDDASRGFSFRLDAPLDMRMDTSSNSPCITAQEWLNTATELEIRRVIYEYGEERSAARIAAKIALTRQTTPITSTGQLAKLVEDTVKGRKPGHHPATRTFQAIRIHINQELQELELAIQHAQALLCEGGILSVISFHSLEDRIVKQALRPESVSVALRHMPRAETVHPWKELRRVKPTEKQALDNPRARSAVLRIAQKVAQGQVL